MDLWLSPQTQEFCYTLREARYLFYTLITEII